jgi:hypothetical protein
VIHPTSGDVYVAGLTSSTNFPKTAGGAQAAFGGGNEDAFIARLNSALTTLEQATYLGGTGDEAYNGAFLAIHPTSGDVYVASQTTSSNLPGTAGGAQPFLNVAPYADAFVARLNPALTTLIQATYLGGSFPDGADALAIHPTSGDVYVSGFTTSSDFPGTAGGAQPFLNGFVTADAFVARLNSALTTLDQATYLGGTGDEDGVALAIHPTSGDVYVAGTTFSLDSSFPGTAGGAQPAFGGGNEDAFIARLNSALTTLEQATYLGGSSDDEGFALAIHPTSGDVYLAGATYSTNFPKTAGGAQAASGGFQDAFVARLNSALTTLEQATYLGGSGAEDGRALAIHPTSHVVYVAGRTSSTNFPATAGGAQATNGGSEDAFVATLSPDLSNVIDPFVSFAPIVSTFITSFPTVLPCPAGTFSFQATLTNKSLRSLSQLVVKVKTLTNGNLLEGADGGPGGVGARMTIPLTGAYADGILAPGEFVDVPFVICLHTSGGFIFFVDVLGDAR